MLWITRHTIRVNRTATAWLVRRFIDPDATFSFVEPNDVAPLQCSQGAIGFDAPGARYPHRDARGRCSFEALVDEYLPLDAALRQLSRIVHGADFPHEPGPGPGDPFPSAGAFDQISPAPVPPRLPEGGAAVTAAAGLRIISRGFPLIAEDHETLERSAFLYDALYASLQASQPSHSTPTRPVK